VDAEPLLLELLLPQLAKTAISPTVSAIRNVKPDFNIRFLSLRIAQ
jgi:hypothetical protein